mgnify:CR=1 FL=1
MIPRRPDLQVTLGARMKLEDTAMSSLGIPWSPRIILPNRTFRLPVTGPDGAILEADGFEPVNSRWSDLDTARYHYLRSPSSPGDYHLVAGQGGEESSVVIQVRTLEECRRLSTHNGIEWPRRWRPGKDYESTKTRQTLQDEPVSNPTGDEVVSWWVSQPDEVIWRQLPPAELPKAHYTNVHHGCPQCGTAIYRYGGFYPWARNHLSCDFKSRCPACNAVFPSNDLMNGDFTSGDYPDDGFGYFDSDGHIFIFAASYHRDQTRAFDSGIQALTGRLRRTGHNPEIARRLGLMLLRYAAEECYVATAPQFRFGAQIGGTEEAWDWGQPDWASLPEGAKALAKKGTQRYAIDTPGIAQVLAIAYDTIWPFLREDDELVSRAGTMGLGLDGTDDVLRILEEMLAIHLQNILDFGASSNLPNESVGALVLLRCLDRPDAGDVMDWLYDCGPDTLRVFPINDFLPDGGPPESTGGYNSIHINGLFSLEYHLRKFRAQHPKAYPESKYPSLVSDTRIPRLIKQASELSMVGRSFFQFGDGSAPGTSSQLGGRDNRTSGSIRINEDCYHASLSPQALRWAAEFTGDADVEAIDASVSSGSHRGMGSTIQDGVGIAILRTPEAPERAAAGIVYGDTHGHRHRDLLDVQLLAYERPFITDLGYPQSWASRTVWEDHWATHNTIWGDLPDVAIPREAGRGRLVRTLFVAGLQIVEVEADRWAFDSGAKKWHKSGVHFRRLIALVETDGEGVALVDLARISGGTTHWRMCRGLEGDFSAGDVPLVGRKGTVADPMGQRGCIDSLEHPDHAALAYMDDVSTCPAPGSWKGLWQSRFEENVHLDIHQLQASAETELLTARATAMMGEPEESTYDFSTVLWRRKPDGDTTLLDLVFEPRIAESTLSEVIAVSSKDRCSSGVRLLTCKGRAVSIYWSPEWEIGFTTFEDGSRMDGPLAAMVDDRTYSTGGREFKYGGKTFFFKNSRKSGEIVAAETDMLSIDLEGLGGVKEGDRLVVNPAGRAHTYKVEAVESLQGGISRVTLDVSSRLGKGRILFSQGNHLEIGMLEEPGFVRFHIMARTGNLNGTRVRAASGAFWAEISNAYNPGNDRTCLELGESNGSPTEVGLLPLGTWVEIVDYVIGDKVLLEQTLEGVPGQN